MLARGAVHKHRDVQDGAARAAVFGISDGLVSNVSLIIGIAGASTDPALIRVAGISGLLAGAVSMAAGEYVSLQAQKELVERELSIERKSIENNLEDETAELKFIYEERGIDPDLAEEVARQIMSNSEIALDVHMREELGVNPEQLGNPLLASISSFVSFSFGAFVPLIPWLMGEGNSAIWSSAIMGISCTALVGGVLARLSGRSVFKTSLRQMLVATLACSATYLIGSLLGTSVV
ncbi:MAG: VIT1/CCC1 transporter family protein [Actinomycetota bacterium]|nr:VIT1/CCC1 transporter family protein [Actinomycetota bacterium]